MGTWVAVTSTPAAAWRTRSMGMVMSKTSVTWGRQAVIQVVIWSDIVWPWCYVGAERWREALRELGTEAAEVEWRYGAFELDPTIPSEGVDARAYLEAKYDAASVAAMHERLIDVFAADGLVLRDLSEQGLRPNTFAAHRLLTAALADGAAVQQAVADGLFRAYWADGADVGDHEVLIEIARDAGMAEDRARGALASDESSTAVREEERHAQEAGIRAVPTFVIDGRLAVTGAQPPVALVRAVRQALAGAGGWALPAAQPRSSFAPLRASRFGPSWLPRPLWPESGDAIFSEVESQGIGGEGVS
jgi:predicted DsbA family dithiol-disulfide isomerase